MRQVKWAALLVLVGLAPLPAQAQRVERAERRVDRLMDRLREEMWSYRRELDFFRRAPEYPRLVDLRYQIREQAIRVADLERRGSPRARFAQREAARPMDDAARELRRPDAPPERP